MGGTDGKYRRGEMPLIKVIWNLIGCGEVCRSKGWGMEEWGGRGVKKIIIWQFKVRRDGRLPHTLQIIHLHPHGVTKAAE